MSVVKNRFELRSTGNEWKGKLVDQDSNPIDLTGFDQVYVIFRKPDGIQFPTDDQMRDGFDQGAILETPSNPEDSFIKFTDTDTPSILDLIGNWEFTVAAKIGSSVIKSPLNTIFWVT